jgi:hypothetical protein
MPGRINTAGLVRDARLRALAPWQPVALAAIALGTRPIVALPGHGTGSERRALRVLGDTLEQVARALSSDSDPDPEWTLRVSHETHHELAALAQARASVARRVAEMTAAEYPGARDSGTIVASVLGAASDDLTHVVDQAHTGREQRAWRTS